MSFLRRLLICFIMITLAFTSVACTSKDTESTMPDEYFAWLRKESGLVEAKIVGDKVQLYYSVCFDNQYDIGILVSSVVGGFSRLDCWGWMKYEKAFVAETEDGQNEVLIPPKTKMSVIFVFEGEYLGGKVNEDITLDSLVFLQNSQEE